MTPDPSSDAMAALIGELADEFTERCQRGESPDVEEYVRRYPKLAGLLRGVLGAVQIMQPRGQTQSVPGKRETGLSEPPRSVKGYEILGILGRGGMGVVYKARQTDLDRIVALKMLLADDAATPAERERFHSEARAVARLRHPNIVPIYEAGDLEGRPFLVLEYLDGGTLEDRLGNPQLPREAAALIETLARALQYAHEQGIVHRDLKPANVLLTAEGTPKVSDFGLAKVLETSGPTISGAIVGTPRYMAPEQAGGTSRNVGPAADVWALGAVLYEMLTGRAPFQGSTTLETLQQVVGREPVPPRSLTPEVPRALETITLHCLRKEPERRYPSATALAEDLARWQAGEPIRARPVGPVTRLALWARRRPAVATMLLVAIVTTLLAVAASSALLVRAAYSRDLEDALTRTENALGAESQARESAEQARGETKNLLSLHRVLLAHREWREANIPRARQLLEECPEDLRAWEWHYVRRLCHPALHTLTHPNTVNHLAPFPTGDRVATACHDGFVYIWDLKNGIQVRRLPETPLPNGFRGLAVHPNGRWLAASGSHGLRVWDVETGEQVFHRPDGTDAIAFSHDGRRLAAAYSRGPLRLWETEGWKQGAALAQGRGTTACLAFSPDGRTLAGGAWDATIRLWDVDKAALIATLTGHGQEVHAVAWSPDGTRLVSASGRGDQPTLSGQVILWDVAARRSLRAYRPHKGAVTGIVWLTGGNRIASVGYDRVVQIWDPTTGLTHRILRGSAHTPLAVACVVQGNRLITAGLDRSALVWDTLHDPEALSIEAGEEVYGVAWSPDGREVAGAVARHVRIWDATTGRQRLALAGHAGNLTRIDWSAQGNSVASSSLDGTVRLWDAATGKLLFVLKGETRAIGLATYSPDGSCLATREQRTIRIWESKTGEVRVSWSAPSELWSLAWSPDGARLATGGADGNIHIWDALKGEEISVLPGHAPRVIALAWSPDGRWLASETNTNAAGEVKIWDLARGDAVRSFASGSLGRNTLSWSPDNRRLTTTGLFASFLLWDPTTGQEALTLRGHDDRVTGLAFCPEGTRLASCSTDRRVRIWTGR